MRSKMTPEEKRERQRGYQKKWAAKNRERLREKDRLWRETNEAYDKERKLQWLKDNPDKARSSAAAYRAAKLQATPSWADSTAIDFTYHCAVVLEKTFGTKWHVDHIVPLQGKTVSGLHVEGNLQLLPASENLKKSNSHASS